MTDKSNTQAAIERALHDFESRERGIPQAHMAAGLVSALRAALAAQPTPEPVAQAEPKRTLHYETASALYKAARRGGARFLLHYHDREPAQITGISLGNGCVWVEAGPMLPVHIRPDGTSKDGPAIWLEECRTPDAAPSPVALQGRDERATFIRWLSSTYSKGYTEDDAAHWWDTDHASALAWKARASLPAGGVVPAGWQLVPIEPTKEMLDAVVTTVDEAVHGKNAEVHYREDWAAMLYAAPQPSETQGRRQIDPKRLTKAAQVLAAYFDYPWDHMPTEGRNNMRQCVEKVMAAVDGIPASPQDGGAA